VRESTNDVYEVIERPSERLSSENPPSLNLVGHQLIEVYKESLVKINHSVLELICAAELTSGGHSADAEKAISDVLVCDVCARNEKDCPIIEIEAGFTPPEHALDAVDHCAGRITSKIAGYGKFCNKFSFAAPVIGILPIPKLFCKPAKSRIRDEVQALKDLCDRHCKNPQIGFDYTKSAGWTPSI